MKEMRKPSANDYEVVLPDVGKFVYARKTIGDFIAIRRRYVEIAGENNGDMILDRLANVTAAHEVLCVSCPDGWEDLTTFDFESSGHHLNKILELDKLIGEKQDSFRKDKEGEKPETGTGTQ